MARSRRGHNKMLGKIILGVVLLIIAVAGLTYGAMVSQMNAASEDYSRGDTEGALKNYQSVETKVRALGLIRVIPAQDRQNLLLNQARIFYSTGRYDDAAEALQREIDSNPTGNFTDGRFFLLRGDIAFRKAVLNYRNSRAKDLHVLEEAFRGAQDNLRDALHLLPNDWDAKYNYEFISAALKALTDNSQEQMKILMEEVEKPQPKALSPEQQS